MPHLLKSNELSPSTPQPMPATDAKVLAFRRPTHQERMPSGASPDWGETEQNLSPLRLQVTEIIDAILAETGPEEKDVREQLRRLVASHPDCPEKALLKHLLNLSA